ncbi:MAG: hypothetical protein WC180_06410 [Candidatus Paceibacterota bacterium]
MNPFTWGNPYYLTEAEAFKLALENNSYLFWGLAGRATHYIEAIQAKREIQAELIYGVDKDD